MSKISYSRRRFLRDGTLLALSTPLWKSAAAPAASMGNTTHAATAPQVRLRWLDGQAPHSFAGVTWGVPWPQGQVRGDSDFQLSDGQQRAYSLQSWPLARWPDGSIKWSAHALGGQQPPGEKLTLRPAPPASVRAAEMVGENDRGWTVDTGRIRCLIPKSGPHLIEEIWQDRRLALTHGRLVLRVQAGAETDTVLTLDEYQGQVETVTVEQRGPQRTVIALRGAHHHRQRQGVTHIPFVIRLYGYADSASLRVVHTLIYDHDDPHQSLKGLGLAFDIPLQGELHDRHVRFASDRGGVFREAVRGLTGLRRDAGAAVIDAQLSGKATPPVAEFPPTVGKRLHHIPAFGSYRLTQHHPDGFQIHKRTKEGQGWLLSATGDRAAGVGYLGTPQGGVAFGIRNFWQSYPACLEINNAHTALATVTLWLWSPTAEPMDMRFYHDGLGQDTFAAQREGLEITYEDYEPGFTSPLGVARTSELFIDILSATPDNAGFVALAQRMQHPPLLVAQAQDLSRARAFGPLWAPASASAPTPQRAQLENQLDWYFDFYRQEVEQRKWYGFWDFGDVMHTYDSDRHVWRYDVGGYAWDNSELSTDLWLWHYFLHSGRAEAFRMAEAMTRHTGEVDVYHLGRFRPLGSRHNVRHWGDSAKQLRISTAANRRFLYYLTADERIGELMDEQIEGVRTLRDVVPGRKIGQTLPAAPQHVSLYFGTDWGAVAAAWLTAWERHGDPTMRERLLNSMQTIAAQPHGFFTGGAEFDPDSGRFSPAPPDQVAISHLSAVFGLAEIAGELLEVLPDPAFTRAWLDYCRLYNDPVALSAVVGKPVKKLNLAQGHARLTAFAAWRLRDRALAQRAWTEFNDGSGGIANPGSELRRIAPPETLYPVDEAVVDALIDKHSDSAIASNLATNAVAQWGLAAIALLALLDDIPSSH
ncbi:MULTISPECIES: Tat pathway signal sequence domain protein [unclassified Brenneria]|uniref:exo-rhamnogalacturonan lyase family protein n=1 Tax=unclassified Brenneria TaxID=2634434 RepID=UPI0029C2A06B|nr:MULTISPECIES: Tat pathway signal sequence domain protein [unclassified Brenneria]MDX5630450.1 Tat pathway signal sequence domain protein [Brenneria sp. L3-3Z]MDX5697595.1 Tat pathway signal sequence domain protein [Brenneria sp. L4-2C]MEE3664334.1 Tat pathway signal sequence domain protein [Brenneria sp. g21c3]